MFRVDFDINTTMFYLFASVNLVYITTQLSLTEILISHTYSLYNEKALCDGRETIFSCWSYYLELRIRIRIHVHIHILIYMHIHINTHTNTQTHTYVHKQTHIHIGLQPSSDPIDGVCSICSKCSLIGRYVHT